MSSVKPLPLLATIVDTRFTIPFDNILYSHWDGVFLHCHLKDEKSIIAIPVSEVQHELIRATWAAWLEKKKTS